MRTKNLKSYFLVFVSLPGYVSSILYFFFFKYYEEIWEAAVTLATSKILSSHGRLYTHTHTHTQTQTQTHTHTQRERERDRQPERQRESLSFHHENIPI